MGRPVRSIVAALVLVSACATPPGTASPAASPPSSRPPVAASPLASRPVDEPSATPFPADDAFARLVDEVTGGDAPAGSRLDVLWTTALRGTPHEAGYRAPAQVVGYRGGEIPDTPCAAGTNVRLWRFNARPCALDRTIYYDESWLRDFADRIGPFAPAAILAHEWGHHIQQVLGTSTISNQLELEADCYAGMYLAAAEQTSPGVYEIGADLEPALKAFFDLGNAEYDESRWFESGEHGSKVQRMMAFGTGYLPIIAGLPWCYGYRDFVPGDHADIGPYRLLNLPGRVERSLGDTFEIAADDRSGVATSDITLVWIDRLPIAGAGATPAQLERVRASRFPGLLPKLVFDPHANVAPGTATAMYVQGGLGDDADAVRSGVLMLTSPADAVGGLVVLASRPGPAPTEPLDDAGAAVLAEELVAVHEIVNRLCTPDHRAGAPGWFDQLGGAAAPSATGSVACLDGQ